MERSRFTLDLSPDFHTRLKVAAARNGQTMRDYCLEAIEDRLSREPGADSPIPRYGDGLIEWLARMQQQVFQGRVTSDSTEIIREERRKRAARI